MRRGIVVANLSHEPQHITRDDRGYKKTHDGIRELESYTLANTKGVDAEKV